MKLVIKDTTAYQNICDKLRLNPLAPLASLRAPYNIIKAPKPMVAEITRLELAEVERYVESNKELSKQTLYYIVAKLADSDAFQLYYISDDEKAVKKLMLDMIASLVELDYVG